MPIKPIDYQVMIPRTNEVSKIHNDEQHRAQMLQQQQSSSVQHKADDSTRLVHAQDKAQEARIMEKEEKERNNKKRDKRKNKGNYNVDSKTEEEIKTSTIDIRL